METKSFIEKENLTMHYHVSANCAKLARSEGEWRKIGIDDNNEIAVVENRHVKTEGMEENDMITSPFLLILSSLRSSA